MPDAESEPDTASLSALSEVDESFLNGSHESMAENKMRKKLAGRPRTVKTSGVNTRDKTHGRTALHKAAARGNIAKMKDLIEEKGAMIDITDNAGVTPLHDACTAGHVEAVRYLIAVGATVSPKDCEGDYPLLDAAQNDNEEICKILLDAGANPTMQNSSGMSALSEAEEGSLKDLLRQFSSRFDSPGQNRMKITDVLTIDDTPQGRSNSKDTARLRASRSSKFNIDSQGVRKVDLNGRDRLHRYVLDGDDELVEQFLEIQDADFQDNYGDTPLHAASRSGNAHICGLLLQHGVHVDVQNKKGNTALHEAAYTARNREVIVALLDAGSSSLVKNDDDKMPVDIAMAELGEESTETRLLQKTVLSEQRKAADKQRKRAARKDRNGSASGSARSTPLHSPRVTREDEVNHANAPVARADHITSSDDKRVSKKKMSNQSLPYAQHPTPTTTPAEVAITVATSTPPEVVSSRQQVIKSGLPTTQFLTEVKSNRLLSHIDSSIRGSPLPSPQLSNAKASPLAASSPLPRPSMPTDVDNTPRSGAEIDDSTGTFAMISPNTLKRKQTNGDSSTLQQKRFRPQAIPESSPTAASEPTTRTQDSHADTSGGMAAAVTQMNKDIVAAIEKQNELLAAMLGSINALVAAQKR